MRPDSTSSQLSRRYRRFCGHLAFSILLLALVFPTHGEPATPEVLWAAASHGDLELVRAALDDGVPVDAEQRHGVTALLMAAGAGHLDVVDELLDRGAKIDQRETFFGTTAIAKALGTGQTELVRRLALRGSGFDITLLLGTIESEDREVLAAFRKTRPLYPFEHRLARRAAAGKAELSAVVESWEVREELPDVPFTPYQLRAYEGVYQQGSETVTVQLEEGTLWLRDPDGERRALTPLNRWHFRARPDHETGVFFLNRAGVVDAVTLDAPGAEPRGFRKNPDAGETVVESAPTEGRSTERFGKAMLPRQTARPWPSFRGANASGVADGQGIRPDWDPASGRGVRFKTPIPGLGLSSPVVWGNRLYLTTTVSADADQSIRTGTYGDPDSVKESSAHEFRVLALDTRSGEIVWQKSLAEAVPGAERHLKSSHANSTAVTDGQTLVVLFPTAGLVALDRDGEILWRQDLGALPSGTHDRVFQWGFASSPILWNGQVIVQADLQGEAYLAAWDLETGELIWRTERDDIPTWSTPTVFEADGHAELVANGSTVRGYDPSTGEELWSIGPSSDVIIATPIFDSERIYVTAGYPPVRAIYAIRPGARGDLSLPPGQRSSESVAWSHDRGGGYMPTPILYRGIFYLPHHNGRLVAYEARTGEEIYRARLSAGGTLTGSPVAADGLLYLTTEQGQIYVVEAGETYRELAVHELGEGIMTTPALSDGTFYVRTLDHLWALAGEPADGPEEGRAQR